jgi:hypothetical protein
MRTIKTNVYAFNELAEDAKEKAIEKFRDNDTEFAWSNEWMDSIKKGLEAFDAELSDWSIDCLCIGRSSYRISCDEGLEITGQRLRTYLLNNYYSNFFTCKPYGQYEKRENGKYRYDRYSNIQYTETCCPFTGFCGDEDFMDVFRGFIKSPDNDRTLADLLKEAVEKTLYALQYDCEHQTSDEGITETIEANEYEFTADGAEI